ncbi:UNVERIFIED_CONTAM: hypothetical protein FKN15_035517 [Acipenser sinensis]
MGKHRKIKAVDPFYHGPRKEQLQGKQKKSDVKPQSGDNLEHIPFRLREIMKSKERMKKQQQQKKTTGADTVKFGEVAMAPPTFTVKPRKAQTRIEGGRKGLLLTSLMGTPLATGTGSVKSSMARQKMMLEERERVVKAYRDLKKIKHERLHSNTASLKRLQNLKYDKSRLNRLLKKKEDRKELREEKEKFIDTVKFGEVAMAPPTFTVKPRKAQTRIEGGRKGLLLTSLMGTPLATGTGSVKSSMARQKMMLEERERVVKAYRDLKKIKHERLHSNTASLKRLQNLK